MNGLFYWLSGVLNSHLLNKYFVFSRKSFVCLNSFSIYLFMSNKQKQKEMKFNSFTIKQIDSEYSELTLFLNGLFVYKATWTNEEVESFRSYHSKLEIKS